MKKKFYLCILFLITSLLYSLPYTHYTSDYLRIRNDYNLNSQIITVLEPNMGVEIIAKGKKETIDGIKSNWVKVISANGYSGWCFAGYLKPSNLTLEAASSIRSIALSGRNLSLI